MSIDVGGAGAGLAAAMRTLVSALAGQRDTPDVLAREQRLVAMEERAGSPLAHPDSPAAFVAPDHRPNVTGQCGSKPPASSMPPLPGFDGELRLLVFSGLPEAAIRQAVPPVRLPPRESRPPTPFWRTERRSAILSDRLPRGQAAILAFVKREDGGAEAWLGHLILWEFVRGAVPGSRLTTASFGDASLARLQARGHADGVVQAALGQVRALAAGEAEPASVGAAAQRVRQEICRKRDLRRALPLPLFAQQLALDASAQIEERLASEICDGRGPAPAVVARKAAERFLAEGLYSAVEAAAPAQAKRVPEAITLHACASAVLPSDTLEAMAMTVERQLGYTLRFADGIALRLGVTPVASPGRGCLALRIDGALVGLADMRAAIQRWFARRPPRDDAVQLCFDARLGAGGGRHSLAVFAALAPAACADAVVRLRLDQLLPTMRL